MERCGAWLRVDAQTRPTMYHAATVTSAELDRLQGLGAENQQAWMGHEAVRSWLGSCRLDAVAAMTKAVPAEDVEACRSRDRLRELSARVVANMRRPRAVTVE